ncbi:YbgC/FadM family acyl-CoA thioesterase [Pseudosulfitobacter sp. DSM 107133]|uniref:YbgC/FadM family acyl-CoA thioesterase n=1 Tax=Pseudosulfitobacter sp. DSM 107133 TaxID=2883100 RepID=UPI000DF3FC1A|nr:YbgC/FadM family acyl-CoA thioesterase [Pseudosulfitobacter sp. DSM 107133]UOA26629.1 Acyl-CoA thioesterase YbgC [Pseudosulfitobacter sp. DSM 107133]
MAHEFPVTVYYEDTDMAGIVYYANYLRFIERARSEIVEELGVDQRAMRAEGIVFAVTRVEADYIGSARLGDRLTVVTTHAPAGAVRWVFDQEVRLGDKAIFRAKVTAACMSTEGRPTRLPAKIRALSGV